MIVSEDAAAADCLRILIADDVPTMRRSMRLMFSQIAGTKVVATAADGQEAVALTRRVQPDIALVDIHMPEMDGLQAIRAMLRYQPYLACIAISAERDQTVLVQAMEVGARGYLVKPFTLEQLHRSVDGLRDVVQENQRLQGQVLKMRAQRDAYLRQLAQEYIQARRVDDKALVVLEQLARDGRCDLFYLQALAVIYVYRQDWLRLERLAVRIARLQQGVRE
jgi:YesN/AraC family two-component response regulator